MGELNKWHRRCYYPLHRGSSCTGPMAVDREQNTMTDVVMVFILDQGMILNSSQNGQSVQKGSTMDDNRC